MTRGRGRAIVVATGHETEIGRIAEPHSDRQTPSDARSSYGLGQLSRAMVALGVAVTALLTLGMLARGASLEEAFLVGVSVAVAAVPEGLAATVTIALAQGARAMAGGAHRSAARCGRDARCRHRVAADKTGTLTINQLRVAASRRRRAEPDTTSSRPRARVDRRSRGGRGRDALRRRSGRRRIPARACGRRRRRPSLRRPRARARIAFDPWRGGADNGLRGRRAGRSSREGRTGDADRTLMPGCSGRRECSQATDWASDGLRVLAVGQRVLDASSWSRRTSSTATRDPRDGRSPGSAS